MSVGGISFMTAYCRGQDAGYSFIDASQRRLCWVHVARNVVAIADSSDDVNQLIGVRLVLLADCVFRVRH